MTQICGLCYSTGWCVCELMSRMFGLCKTDEIIRTGTDSLCGFGPKLILWITSRSRCLTMNRCRNRCRLTFTSWTFLKPFPPPHKKKKPLTSQRCFDETHVWRKDLRQTGKSEVLGSNICWPVAQTNSSLTGILLENTLELKQFEPAGEIWSFEDLDT